MSACVHWRHEIEEAERGQDATDWSPEKQRRWGKAQSIQPQKVRLPAMHDRHSSAEFSTSNRDLKSQELEHSQDTDSESLQKECEQSSRKYWEGHLGGREWNR